MKTKNIFKILTVSSCLILIQSISWSQQTVIGEYPPRFRTTIPQMRVPPESAIAAEVNPSHFLKPDAAMDLVSWGEAIMAISKVVSTSPDLDLYIDYDVKESDNMNLDAKKHTHLVRAQRFFAHIHPPVIQGSDEMSYNLKWISKIYVQVKKSSEPLTDQKNQIEDLAKRLTEEFKKYARERRKQPNLETPPIQLIQRSAVRETLDQNPGFVFGPGVEQNSQLMRQLRTEAQFTDAIVAQIEAAGSQVLDFFSAVRIAQNIQGTHIQRPMIRTPGDQDPALPILDNTVIQFPALDESVQGVSLNLESHHTNPSGIMTHFLGMKDWRWTYPFALTLTSHQKKGTPEQELIRFQTNTANVINALINANLPIFVLVPPNWNDENFKNSVTSVEMRWLLENLNLLKQKNAKVYFVVGAYQYRTLSQSYSAMRIAAEADARAKGVQSIEEWDTLVKTADDVSIEGLLKAMEQRNPNQTTMIRCEESL